VSTSRSTIEAMTTLTSTPLRITRPPAAPETPAPTRTPSSPGTLTAATTAARISATSVALIAGYSSYLHIAHVALHYGERPEAAYALPFAIDGLLIVATTAMLDDTRHARHVRWSARMAFTIGVTASLAANVASAQATPGARIVAAIPAIALLLAVEVISRTGRPTVPITTPANPRRTTAAAGPTRAHPANDDSAAGPTDQRSGQTSPALPANAGHTPNRRPTTATATAAKVAALLAVTPDANTATVATQLGVSPRTARRHLSALRPTAHT